MKLLERIKRRAEFIRVSTLTKSPRFVQKQLQNGRDVVVMYHGVDNCSSQRFNFRHISRDTFKVHLNFFGKHFQVVPLPEIFNSSPDQGKPRLAITFDDGYQNNFDNAVPLLEKARMPATIFVTAIRAQNWDILWPDFWDLFAGCTNVQEIGLRQQQFKRNASRRYDPFVSSDGMTLQGHMKDLNFSEKEAWLQLAFEVEPKFKESLKPHREYWELVSEDHLRGFRSKYVQIGCHGLSHDNLGRLSETDRQRELLESKKWLEERLDQDVTSLAYPDGCYNAELIDFAESLGFREQLAVSYRSPDDRLDHRILDRVGVYAFQKPAEQLWGIVKSACAIPDS